MTLVIYSLALITTILGCRLYKNNIYRNEYFTISLERLAQWRFRKNSLVIYLVIILPSLLLVSLRYGIGGDYYNYKNFYEQFFYYGYSQFEPLTEELMKLNDVVFGEYQCFLAIVAILTYVLSLIWILKNSDVEYCSLAVAIFLCFYFAHSMNTIIQVLASAVIMWSVVFIQKRKFIPFAVIVGIAALIHSSALVFLPLYFVGNKKNETRDIYSQGNILKIFIIVFICAIFAFLYFTVASKYGWLYSGYIGKSSEGGNINVYIRLGVLFYVPELLCMPRLLKVDNKYEVFYIFLIIEMVSFIMTLYAAYAFRLAYYFSFTHCILIPAVIQKGFNKKSRWAVKLYFICALLFYFYFTVFVCKYNYIFEYQSIFGNI